MAYTYDVLGRRVKKDFKNHQDSSKDKLRYFIYDGSEMLAELNSTSIAYGREILRRSPRERRALITFSLIWTIGPLALPLSPLVDPLI